MACKNLLICQGILCCRLVRFTIWAIKSIFAIGGNRTSQTLSLRILELAGIRIYPPQPTKCPLCAWILKDDGGADIVGLRPYCSFRPLSLFSDWYAMRPGSGTLRLERIGLWPCITLGALIKQVMSALLSPVGRRQARGSRTIYGIDSALTADIISVNRCSMAARCSRTFALSRPNGRRVLAAHSARR